jgi:membrane fusion protein (multidrug efflux system)
MKPHVWLGIAATILTPLCVALTGCQHGETHATEAEAPVVRPVVVTVAPVAERDVERRIQVVGTLAALETIPIGAKVTGRVERVLVDVSDRVEAGATLVEIDSIDYALAVDEAQRNLERELARLGLTELPDQSFDPETLPSVIRARLLIEHAKKEFERAKRLAEKGAGSMQEYEQTETNLRVEQAAQRQIMIEVNSTLAAVRHAQTRLATARRQLSETRIVAPTIDNQPMLPSGKLEFVVAKRMVAPGEMVTATSGPLLQLAIDDVLKLIVNVPERYAGQVTLGQAVDVQVEAYPGETFSATVSRKSPTIDRDSRTFVVEALVNNPDHRLQDGAFAKASVLMQPTSKAITAPIEAISTFAGVTKVFVVQDGQAKQIPVTLGARGDGWVELIGDVPPDAMIVTSGHSQLTEGTPIEIREELTSASQSTEATH